MLKGTVKKERKKRESLIAVESSGKTADLKKKKEKERGEERARTVTTTNENE